MRTGSDPRVNNASYAPVETQRSMVTTSRVARGPSPGLSPGRGDSAAVGSRVQALWDACCLPLEHPASGTAWPMRTRICLPLPMAGTTGLAQSPIWRINFGLLGLILTDSGYPRLRE